MARAGLGKDWECLFANDIDELKAATYISNWGRDHFDDRDVRKVSVDDLEGSVDLAWASFPCQDLSLAGNGLGIGRADDGSETRSGALWPFLTLMEKLRRARRQPTTHTIRRHARQRQTRRWRQMREARPATSVRWRGRHHGRHCQRAGAHGHSSL
nr:DNA cytosine methyltransferase [Paraburkholderia sp. C35]